MASDSGGSGLPAFGAKRALLLQGPMGPFFRRFAAELATLGVTALKVDLNAGDGLFSLGSPSLAYRGTAAAWPAFLERTLREQRIDAIYLFGDGRPYHRRAVEVAERLGVPVFVFEEGYLRPDWITLERGGVNGHSRMPRDSAFFMSFVAPPGSGHSLAHVGSSIGRSGWYSTLYALALTLCWPLYPHYQHHRPLNAFAEAFRWVRSALRKIQYRRREAGIQERLVRDHAQRFFLVPLQVHCDYQLVHSEFDTVEAFIETVAQSFKEHAPPDNLLVIKHHPLDRAYRDYTTFLAELAARLELKERLVYIHDQHLPTLLAAARGTVMINSTVGLQAALQGVPVKVLGAAVYNFDGITSQSSLAEFWREPGQVDTEVTAGFRAYLLATNQANGNFYKRLPDMSTPTGVRWTP
jgi:capsule polysaccharide modification protein KpsS